jgi:hypothetical protein
VRRPRAPTLALELVSENFVLCLGLVRANRSVRNPSACFRRLFERVGECPIEAGVTVVGKKNVSNGVDLGILAVVMLLSPVL